MWHRRTAAPLAMAQLVETSSGNVRIPAQDEHVAASLPVQSPQSDDTAAEATGWSIRDADGHIVASGLGSRGEAMRQIGIVAVRGRNAPYVVVDPHGRPTGDRLS